MTEAGRETNPEVGRDEFDFDRLERAVEFLLAEHQRLTSEHAELLEELVTREHRILSLEESLEQARTQRRRAAESVDKILNRIEQLQASVQAASESA